MAKLFRVNLKQLLMLAVFVGLSVSFWSMLDDHLVHEYELFDFSHDESRVLFEVDEINESFGERKSYLQVVDFGSNRRVSRLNNPDVPSVMYDDDLNLYTLTRRFGDHSHVILIPKYIDQAERYERSAFQVRMVWDLDDRSLGLVDRHNNNPEIESWQRQVEETPKTWDGAGNPAFALFDPARLGGSKDRVITGTTPAGKVLTLQFLGSPSKKNPDSPQFLELLGVDSSRQRLFEIEFSDPIVVFSRHLELFFVYCNGPSARGVLLDNELRLVKNFDLDSFTLPLISKDGSRLVIVSDDGFSSFDPKGKLISSHSIDIDFSELGRSTDLLLSGQGSYLAVATKNRIQVIDIESGRLMFNQKHRAFSSFSRNLIYAAIFGWPFAAALWFWPRRKTSGRLTKSIAFAPIAMGVTLIPVCFAMALSKNVFLDEEILSPAFYFDERGWSNAFHSFSAFAIFLTWMTFARPRINSRWLSRSLLLVCQLLFGLAAVYWGHVCLALIGIAAVDWLTDSMEYEVWVKWSGAFWFASTNLGVLLCLFGARFWTAHGETKSLSERNDHSDTDCTPQNE